MLHKLDVPHFGIAGYWQLCVWCTYLQVWAFLSFCELCECRTTCGPSECSVTCLVVEQGTCQYVSGAQVASQVPRGLTCLGRPFQLPPRAEGEWERLSICSQCLGVLSFGEQAAQLLLGATGGWAGPPCCFLGCLEGLSHGGKAAWMLPRVISRWAGPFVHSLGLC